MPFHPVTAALMYRGIYTVPNLLSEQRPVDIPEDELEGECPAGTPARWPSYLCAQVKRGLGAQGGAGLSAGACCQVGAPASSCAGRLDQLAPLGAAVGVAKAVRLPSPCPRGSQRCGNLLGPAAGSRGLAVRGDGAATQQVGVGVRAAPLVPTQPEHPRPDPLRGARPRLCARIDIPLMSLLKSNLLGQLEKGRGRLPCSCQLQGCPQPLAALAPSPQPCRDPPSPERREGSLGGGGDNKWPDSTAWS